MASTGKKKPCHCKNSKCLKLYCECFATGSLCEDCECRNCHNDKDHERERLEAVESTLERNPHAFRPKIAHSPNGKPGRGSGHRQVHHKVIHTFQSSKNVIRLSSILSTCSDFDGYSGLQLQEIALPQKVLRMLPSRHQMLRELQVPGLQVKSPPPCFLSLISQVLPHG